mmetsp:Transcript_15804/g.23264  ORF Transcript_15804/g.23264 Transcript_15804/m.23264 type:complete len:248 (+) Transcript_15804:151-894(+)
MTRPVVTGCAQSNYPKLIYNETTWKSLRRSYRKAVEKKSTINPDDDDPRSGFRVPYEVRHSPIRGRSIFVTKPVKRGKLLWRGDYDAAFTSAVTLRRFLEMLPWELQCEILLWAYPVEGGEAHVALDAGSFVNHGETIEQINFGPNDRAVRDIDAGEEILMNYTEFIEYDSNSWFDDIRAAAWNDDEEEHGDSTTYHSTQEYNQIGAPKRDSGQKSYVGISFLLVFVLLSSIYILGRQAKCKKKHAL